MQPDLFLQFLHTLEALKCNTRHSWTSTGRHETVAAHSWRLAVMALLLRDEFPGVDMDKVLRMCLIHDFGEAVTGDIPSFEKSEKDETQESYAVTHMLAALPQAQQQEFVALFAEMDAQASQEAKIYKALDKIEAVIQHNEAPLDSWIPLEYDLNRTYGTENCAPFPFLAALRTQIRADTDAKLAPASPASPNLTRASQGDNDSECFK